MRQLRRVLLAPYHYAWAVLSGLWYGFPSNGLTVIGVTGTKGKSSVSEMLYTILEASGHKTALAGTIRFAIGKESKPNLFKMTLPGRGFIQKFLAEALTQRCTHAVVEITSEAALQYRHIGLNLNALVFTNLQKEHIESHGSMENYARAKFTIGESLVASPKRPRAIIANNDSSYGAPYLALSVEDRIPFSFGDAQDVSVSEDGVSFLYNNVRFSIPQPGRFSVLNALAAIKAAEWAGVALPVCADALKTLAIIPGRAERIDVGQTFTVVVDYAHTPDSLSSLYEAFGSKENPKRKLVCVLGNTGGGRDVWKRPLMGKIAEDACGTVILTNEDPYDEDPQSILAAMANGMQRAPIIILNRREAIRHALSLAHTGDAVLISGKGTDPFIMGPRGSKTPWSDATVVREEIANLLAEKR